MSQFLRDLLPGGPRVAHWSPVRLLQLKHCPLHAAAATTAYKWRAKNPPGPLRLSWTKVLLG